jgi:hypothetical protein
MKEGMLMADLTRRGFLAQVSVTTGVGIAGGLGLRQLLNSRSLPTSASKPMEASAVSPSATPFALDGVTLAGPMVIHVRDVPTAEISMMVGTQELIYRDPELVSRLVRTAASAATQEA